MNNRKIILIGSIALSLFAGTFLYRTKNNIRWGRAFSEQNSDAVHNLNQYITKLQRDRLQEMKTEWILRRSMMESLITQLIYPLVWIDNENYSSMTKELIIKELTQLQQIRAMQQYTRLFEESVSGSIEHMKKKLQKLLNFIPQAEEWEDIKIRMDRLRSLDNHSGSLNDKLDNFLISKIETDPSFAEKISVGYLVIKISSFTIEKLNQGIQIFDEEVATPRRAEEELDAIVDDIFRDLSEYPAKAFQEMASV